MYQNVPKNTAVITAEFSNLNSNASTLIIEDIIKFANQKNIIVIEDCAEAVGSYYCDKHVGNFGDAATFSFFGNKTL